MRANALAVMAKAPLPGEVKTRLQPALSAAEAAELARALLVDQLAHLTAITDADLYLAFAPPATRPLFRDLAPPEFRLLPQKGDDLGARMANLFEGLHSAGHRRIVLIGGDLPPVPLEYFTAAFGWLDSSNRRVVLGPSRDGGYYLVGCNRPVPELFTGMTWSHGEVLAHTLAKLTSLPLETRLVPEWFDIDILDDLRDLRAKLGPDLAPAATNCLSWVRRMEQAGRIPQ